MLQNLYITQNFKKNWVVLTLLLRVYIMPAESLEQCTELTLENHLDIEKNA